MNNVLRHVNVYEMLLYTLIYKYSFCYIFLLLFLRFSLNKLDWCGPYNYEYYFLNFIISVNLFNLFSIPILTFFNIILILINIYRFNKIDNNGSNEYINEIKKINRYEFLTIIICFILFITSAIIIKLYDFNIDDFNISKIAILISNVVILTVILGIFPISILEILFYFEKKKKNLNLK